MEKKRRWLVFRDRKGFAGGMGGAQKCLGLGEACTGRGREAGWGGSTGVVWCGRSRYSGRTGGLALYRWSRYQASDCGLCETSDANQAKIK